jgi:hypothetical protein
MPAIRTFADGASPWRAQGVFDMADLLMLGIGLGLFVLTLGYCHLCDRL